MYAMCIVFGQILSNTQCEIGVHLTTKEEFIIHKKMLFDAVKLLQLFPITFNSFDYC